MWTDRGLAQLQSWGLSESDAAGAGLFETADASHELAGCPPRPGIVLPYYQPSGELMRLEGRPFGRVRWLDTPHSRFGGKVKAARYGQPPGTGVQVYFPPLVDWASVLADAKIPLLITEGEAKALRATLAGYRCIALGGVNSFGKFGQLLPVLAAAQWKGRQVAIVYDSDAATNPAVLAAEAQLVELLGTQLGAQVRIVRLPEDQSAKVGLDDFLSAHGTEGLDRLLEAAPALGTLDMKVLSLNRHVAWITAESGIYELATGRVIPRADFVNGESYSSLKHVVTGGGPKAAPKTLLVAEQWLKHPHAQRYAALLFRPGEPEVLTDERGARALNLWTGWAEEEGDVGPWLRLGDALFRNDPSAEIRELPLKLTAYKAQNPKEKIPLALVLTGPVGTGKTMWVDSIRRAFAPWSAAVAPTSLNSDFHPWIEKSVVATINELDVELMRRNAQLLMALITDERRSLNDKFRRIQEVNSPTLYYITSNYSGVGAGFSHDDRRVIGIQTPAFNGNDALHDDILKWWEHGGPRHLMHYLLNYDLKGWKPPRRAPMTASKRLAYREGMTPIQLLAEDMRSSSFNTLVYWLDLAKQWAEAAEISSDGTGQAMGRAVKASIQHIQVRPWYTAEELTTIFPSVLSQVYATSKDKAWTPGQLSRTLRDSGIPFLVNRDNPDGFAWQGRMRQYLIISDFDSWRDPIGQADFERSMANWPTYQQLKREQKK